MFNHQFKVILIVPIAMERVLFLKRKKQSLANIVEEEIWITNTKLGVVVVKLVKKVYENVKFQNMPVKFYEYWKN